MLLHEYFCERKKQDPNFTRKQFAVEHGFNPMTLSKYVRGRLKPSIKAAKKFEEATKGIVKCWDLMKSYEDEEAAK